MKKFVLTICVMFAAIIAFMSGNNSLIVLKGDVEALSMQEFNTGYSVLYCFETERTIMCYSWMPGEDEPVEFPAKGGSVELFYD